MPRLFRARSGMFNLVRRGRSGFALFTAIMAIVVVSVLSGPLAFMLRNDTALASSKSVNLKAEMAAEGAVWKAINLADSLDLGTIGIFDPILLLDSIGIAETQTFITRVDTSIYWIVGSAKVGYGRNLTYRKVGLSSELYRETVSASDSVPDTVYHLRPIPLWGWIKLY